MSKLFSHVLTTSGPQAGKLVIISLREGTSEEESYYLAKTLFELHRLDLLNPPMSGEELETWQMNLHFDDYTGARPWITRDITGEILPDRERRYAWRDNGNRVFDDTTILVPSVEN